MQHAEVEHRVHLHRYVVPSDDFLGWHVHDDLAQTDAHQAIDAGNEKKAEKTREKMGKEVKRYDAKVAKINKKYSQIEGIVTKKAEKVKAGKAEKVRAAKAEKVRADKAKNKDKNKDEDEDKD